MDDALIMPAANAGAMWNAATTGKDRRLFAVSGVDNDAVIHCNRRGKPGASRFGVAHNLRPAAQGLAQPVPVRMLSATDRALMHFAGIY